MVGLSNNQSAFLHNPEVHNFKILFRTSFNIQEADYNLLNKYVIYKINQYQIININGYSL